MIVVAIQCMACVSTQTTLDYQARVDDLNFDLIRQSEPVVVMGFFEDSRSSPGTHFATVRGGFGNVLKNIHASEPIAEVVRRAFKSGFKIHGQLSEDDRGRVLVTGDVTRFDTEMFMAPTTKITVDVLVSDFESNVVRFADSFEIEKTGSRPGGLGVNASAYEIKAFTESVLTELVNQVIGDERFLEALR